MSGVVCVRRRVCWRAAVAVSVKLWVRLVGVTSRSGGFGGLGALDGWGHGLDAVGRGECPLACALASSGSWFVRLPLGGARCVAGCRCLLRPVLASLRRAVLGVVVGPGQGLGGSAAGWGCCCRQVRCLWRCLACSGWVEAGAVRGGLWPAGRIGSGPGVGAYGFSGLRRQAVSSACDPGLAEGVPPVGLGRPAAG